MSYKIEKNIEIPESSRRNKYPFDKMKVGDSFKVEDGHQYYRAMSSVYQFQKGRQVKFKGVKSELRIWRVK